MSCSWSILPQTQNLNRLIRQVFNSTTGESEQNSGQASDVKVLFEQLAEVAKAGQQEIFQALVAAERQKPDEEVTLLIAAVMENQLEVVNAFITAGSDVNTRIKLTDGQFEFTALFYAVRNASLPIVETLLRAGANPKWSDPFPSFAPIFQAIEQSNTALVQLLIQYGATVVFRSNLEPLFNAAGSDNPEIIRLLLDAGCDIDARRTRDSALKRACQYGNLKVIKLLLESGASLSSSGDEIGTAFLSPVYVESMTDCSEQKARAIEKVPAAIQLLLGAGVDPNVKTWNGTPLILAIAHGYVEVVQNLLAAGADPNLQSRFDYEETIPLHHAAKLGQREMVQTLIEAGADIAATDHQDKTATAIAVAV
ncbi:MAG: hypothetical protein F6J87_29150, partial [Spirulina sp. SIO3F2]|nr:hypothetical protein [Spirulina sp. SIO3F2]